MSRIWPQAMTNWKGFPSGASGKEPACWCRRYKKHRVQPLGQEDPQRRAWQSTPGFLPRESHGQRSLAGYSPLGRRVGLKQLSTHCMRDMHYIHDKPKAKAFTFKDLKCASNSWCCLRMPCEFRKFSKTVPGKRPTQVNKTSLQQHSATLTILENLKWGGSDGQEWLHTWLSYLFQHHQHCKDCSGAKCRGGS